MAQQPQPSLGQRVLRSSAYAVGASLITLTLGLVRSVVLARLLVPEHFGVVALALFYIGLAAQLRGIGLDAALIHRQQADRAFMRTYFGLRLGLDALAFGILLALVPLLQHANPHSPNLSAVLVVLTPTFFFSSLAQVQETLARKQLAFNRAQLAIRTLRRHAYLVNLEPDILGSALSGRSEPVCCAAIGARPK